MLLFQRFRCAVIRSGPRYCAPQYLQLCSRLTGPVFVRKQSYSSDFWDRYQTSKEMGKRKNSNQGAVKLDKEKNKAPASKIVLSVVGNGKMGAPKSLLITTTYSNYMFNIGEGSTRVIEESKMKINRLEQVFITHNSWANLGGMVGLVINMYQGKEDSKLRLHGPPNVEKLIMASRNFCDIETLVLGKSEVSEGGYEDTTFRFEYVPLLPTKEMESKESASKKRKIESSQLGDKDGKDADTLRDMSVVYICKPKPLRRNINLKKCLDRGLPTGKFEYVRQLLLEKDVTLEDGTLVKADDVLDSYRGDLGSVVVMECPSAAYLPALDQCGRLQGLRDVHAVVHFTPAHVVASPTYQQWMHGLDPSVKHFMLNEHSGGGEVCLVTPLENQVLLNQLHSDMFPTLGLQQQQHEAQTAQAHSQAAKEECSTRGDAASETNMIHCQTNMTYTYREGRNHAILASENCPTYNWQSTYEQISNQYLTSEKIKSLKMYLETLVPNEAEGEDAGKYPEVVFLGTGSSKPSALRNASSILVRLSKHKYIILDCGEGTYGQLLRFYGTEKTLKILRNLRAIFISHLHADHHMGVLAVLTARHDALGVEDSDSPPPYVLSSNNFHLWLKLIHDSIIHSKHLYRFVSLESVYGRNNSMANNSVLRGVCEALGLKQFSPVRVDHRQYPFGIVLCSKKGYKLVYSGDTRPCDDLVRAGMNCDLLIHEATLADSAEAHSKYHSSFSQALETGDRMKAKFTLLTHLSQRYANLSDDASKEFDLSRRNYGLAFDNMRVSPALLPVAASLVPVVKHLFAGLRKSDYPPLIDEEINEILRDTPFYAPPATKEHDAKDSNDNTEKRENVDKDSAMDSAGKNADEHAAVVVNR